jgi:glycosyltransferase involved in cell wall biosynthesis
LLKKLDLSNIFGMPSVGIDAFNISMPNGTGIATYGRNLNSALRQIGCETHILYGPAASPGSVDLLNEIALLDAAPRAGGSVARVSRLARSLVFPLGRNAKPLAPQPAVLTQQVASVIPPCDALWVSRDIFHSANAAFTATRRFTPLHMGPRGPDVMHWTCSLPLRATGRANFYTIHDLVPLRLPYASLDNKRRFLSLNREICARADCIVTVSDHSKNDIVSILGASPDRVFVTHQSVVMPHEANQRSDEDVVNELAGVFGLDWRGYFLFFGAIEPKKNLARVLEAYLAINTDTPLVIVSGRSWLDNAENRMFEIHRMAVEAHAGLSGKRNDRIRQYDYMPLSLLFSLIRGAKATLMPSLYEGFGLPVLESMVLRTPVLTSTQGSLPEVAGDAAILVDPYDSHAIGQAIRRLDADEDLRNALIARGELQARKFSPEVYQQKLVDLYEIFG